MKLCKFTAAAALLSVGIITASPALAEDWRYVRTGSETSRVDADTIESMGWFSGKKRATVDFHPARPDLDGSYMGETRYIEVDCDENTYRYLAGTIAERIYYTRPNTNARALVRFICDY